MRRWSVSAYRTAVVRVRLPVKLLARACSEAEGKRQVPLNDWIVGVIERSLPRSIFQTRTLFDLEGLDGIEDLS